MYHFSTFFLFRDVERELFPCLRRLGMSFYAYNPVCSFCSFSHIVVLPKFHSSFPCVLARRWTIDRETSIRRQRERNYSAWPLWRHGPVGWRVSCYEECDTHPRFSESFWGFHPEDVWKGHWGNDYIRWFLKISGNFATTSSQLVSLSKIEGCGRSEIRKWTLW